MLKWLSSISLKIVGWEVVGTVPVDKKLVIIGAPHTSNWDFPLSLLALTALGLRFSWVAKHTLFRPPFNLFFKAIGGIPVNRTKRSSFLEKIAQEFANRDQLLLAIAPEGTRSRGDHWKTGFYFIAMKAEVEICLGFVDYQSKTVGLGPQFKPTGDVTKDFSIIVDFYKSKTGKYPNKQNDLRLRDKEVRVLYRELSSRKSQID